MSLPLDRVAGTAADSVPEGRGSRMHVVVIETAGTQRYIFSTEKLVENVGASQLVYDAGTTWVLEALRVSGLGISADPTKPEGVREALNHPARSPRVDGGALAEVVSLVSGRSLILVRDRQLGEDLIWRVTRRALEEAPGLDVCGVVGEAFDWAAGDVAEEVRRVLGRIGEVRAKRLSPELRFLRLPPVADCAVSGLPASRLDLKRGGERVSEVSWRKREASRTGSERLRAHLEAAGLKAPEDIGDLERRIEGLEWLAVAHADGNGIGQLVTHLDRYLRGGDAAGDQAGRNRAYVDRVRAFSLALDACAEEAFKQACRGVFGRGQLAPVLPLVLGGDDLTVIVDARAALPFVVRYLRAFEDATGRDPTLRGIAREAFGAARLAATAGVAIVKPHFPWAAAYDLAEALLESAKVVKRKVTKNGRPYPCSALDFHVLLDPSASDLSTIRERLEVREGGRAARLWAGPYVVTEDLDGAQGASWAELHSWSDAEGRAEALSAKDEEGRRRLPSSQVHRLRAALFRGRDYADAVLGRIYERYRRRGLEKVVAGTSPPSLFWDENGTAVSPLIDAMEAAAFIEG